MNTMPSDTIILAIAIFLYLCNFAFDWWLWKKSGDRFSAIRGILLKNGVDSAFGVVSAAIFLVFVIISYFVLTGLGITETVPLKRLLILTGCVYIGLAIFLNVWGKRFLLRQGIDPKPKDGYKGFFNDLRDSIAEKKEEQRKKDDESLL